MPSETDRLIEEGLSRYGSGDLDGALASWEQALALDPGNDQAQSYVDYVRANYQLLAQDPEVDEDGAPFGIDEELEYQIEVSPGDLTATDAVPATADPDDEGWAVDDEPLTIGPIMRALEIEADEPPLGGLSFDEATREFVAGPPPISIALAADDAGTFAREEPTAGFSSQPTDVKKRDLGFVQASELKVTLRTPAAGAAARPEVREAREVAPPSEPAPNKAPITRPDDPDDDEADALPPISPAPTSAPSSIGEALRELGQSGRSAQTSPPSLSKPGAVTVDIPVPRGATRELPMAARLPAKPSSPPIDVLDPRAVTFSEPGEAPGLPPLVDIHQLGLTSAPTRDLGLRPGEPTTRDLGLRPGEPTTRDLGLRPGEPTTRDLGLRPPRADDAAARRGDGRATVEAQTEGTRFDIVLPFDPIDARSAQILEEVDDDAPANEAKEDRVRRRITSLIDKATAWNSQGEYDKAVTAADLAMSEDPNSALAQKLLQRHRDAIQGVFQNFLGDLQRQPQLARPLHELAAAPISPRAAFLLSRIDGMLSIDELLDVSGMPRVEAYRHLCQLFLRNILR